MFVFFFLYFLSLYSQTELTVSFFGLQIYIEYWIDPVVEPNTRTQTNESIFIVIQP